MFGILQSTSEKNKEIKSFPLQYKNAQHSVLVPLNWNILMLTYFSRHVWLKHRLCLEEFLHRATNISLKTKTGHNRARTSFIPPLFADTTVFSSTCEERCSAYLPSEKCHFHSVSERVATLIDLFTESNSQAKKRGRRRRRSCKCQINVILFFIILALLPSSVWQADEWLAVRMQDDEIKCHVFSSLCAAP